MKLVRYESPSLPFAGDLDRIFDASFNRLNSLFNEGFFGPAFDRTQLAADTYEDDGHYYLRFELPGVKKDHVQIDLENNVLTVSGQWHQKNDQSEQKARFNRSVGLPEGINRDGIKARLEDGVLTVTLPKSEQAKARQIQIQ